MTQLIRRALAFTACIMVLATGASAQVPALPAGMSPEQAAALVASSPALQQQVRQRLQQSGLSREEIHQRLSAAGYPSTMLDPYITTGTDAGLAPALDAETVKAIALLGVDAFPPAVTHVTDSVIARLRADTVRTGGARALQLFGIDVLRQSSTRFQPVSGPADDSYALGPGDQMVLFLTGGVEATQVLDVTSQGFVVISKVGQVYVNSLTLGQFRNLLYSKLSQVYPGISRGADARTQFDISVAKVRVQSLRVAGEVARPGTYQVAATGGVLSAIYEAGGLTELGSFRRVEIRRGRALIGTVDLYEYLLKGVVGGEPNLLPGDVVFVPTHGPRVKLAGEVVRPAIYELKATETLRDAVRIAGGLTPWAATESASVDRLLPPGQRPEPGYVRTVLTASLREVVDSTAAPTALFAEDSVTVYRVTGGRRASVAIDGNVYQGGAYRLEPGMRLWDLIRAARGLRTDTYGGRVQILRTLPDSTRRLMGFELDSASPANNPPLEESDKVTVYATTTFRPQRYITVYGAVQHPGPLAFADSMTLRDAILYAGGLREDAFLGEAEISRLRERQTVGGDSLAVILRVAMDSSYVVDSTGYVQRPVGRPSTPDVVLSPYDNVFVRHQPGWELQRNVAIGGEVQFPGRYTLTTKDERLSSVIARAGGLSPNAYARGLQVFRRSADGGGRIAVDLPRVLRDPRFKDNVVLAAGDSLYIPPFLPTVRVDGAVNFPTSVTYMPNGALSYYIGAAGGYGPQADKKRAFVRQPNGLIERGGQPEPGATVSVPTRDPNERRTLTELVPFFTAAVQIITAGATLIIAVTR